MPYAIIGLVVGYKILGTFLSGLLPLAMAERGVEKFYLMQYDEMMDTASLSVVLLLATFYNFVFPVPGKKTGLACVAILFAASYILSFPPAANWSHNMDYLFWIFVACHVSIFLLGNIACAWSVSTTLPLSRYRALGTAAVQLAHLLVLFLPEIFATTTSLLAIASLACSICLWGVMRYKTLELYKTGSQIEERFTHGVSTVTALSFIFACIVGLNGEQILDASLKLNLRAAHWEGDRYPIAINHIITASSRLLAFGMSSSLTNTSSLMGIWTVTQLLRLVLMGAHADLSSLWVTGGLILLDKWSGTLGEIALEAALLRHLADAPRGIFPAIYVMSLYQPLEDITGSAVKVFVREAKNAKEGTYLYLFQENKGLIIAGMVIFIFVLVVRWSKTKNVKESDENAKGVKGQ